MNTRTIHIIFFSIVTCLLQAQNYNTSDSLALLNIDAQCDASDALNWDTESDPGAWNGVMWNADNPARVTDLSINELELVDTLNVTSLDSLLLIVCDGNNTEHLVVSDLEPLRFLNNIII